MLYYSKGTVVGMKKEQINSCIELTKEIMNRHYQGNLAFVAEQLHKNCMWIGSNADEFYQGKDSIIAVLKRDAEKLPHIQLTSQEYMCASHDTHECIIMGRYIGVTSAASGEIYRDMQRVTFVWKEEKGKLSVIHMHVSNPLNNVVKGEAFPNQLASYTKEYLDMLVNREVEKKGTITVKDQQNRYHVVQVSDILYCEAFNMNSILHMKNDIFARITLVELEEQLKEKGNGMFCRIHKSYLVNRYHVLSLKRYELTIRGNHHVPVSKQHYNEIREWVQR
ncbi:regulator [Erysipelotrichaceae bacterium 66202529]|nr:regulator [Erysipelotrichaceae bacterium 66202529]